MTQKGFDEYRQQIWEQGVALVDAHDKAKAAGQLTAPMLASLIVSLSTLMESFNSQYLQVRASTPQEVLFGKISPEWIDSRFHDYYDFFTVKIIPPWEAELRGMQAAQSQTVAATSTVTSTGSTMQYSSNQSQAGASSTPIPQPAYVPQQQYVPAIDNQTTVVEQAYDTSPETKSASLSPLLIGGLVLGLIFMGRKKAQ